METICTMIEAEMYGITPMAKIDKRSIAPPENMLAMPSSVPAFSSKKRDTSAGSIPGTGMKVPMR